MNKEKIIKLLDREIDRLEEIPDRIDKDGIFDGEDIYEDGKIMGQLKKS